MTRQSNSNVCFIWHSFLDHVYEIPLFSPDNLQRRYGLCSKGLWCMTFYIKKPYRCYKADSFNQSYQRKKKTIILSSRRIVTYTLTSVLGEFKPYFYCLWDNPVCNNCYFCTSTTNKPLCIKLIKMLHKLRFSCWLRKVS